MRAKFFCLKYAKNYTVLHYDSNMYSLSMIN